MTILNVINVVIFVVILLGGAHLVCDARRRIEEACGLGEVIEGSSEEEGDLIGSLGAECVVRKTEGSKASVAGDGLSCVRVDVIRRVAAGIYSRKYGKGLHFGCRGTPF